MIQHMIKCRYFTEGISAWDETHYTV